MATDAPIRLVVTGDDFGISRGANEAILRAHKEGILTSASLMINGNAARDAIRIAKENPSLGVGLHITLVQGRSSLKPSETLGLVDQRFQFDDNPVRAGLRYFFNRSLRQYLRQEINAQVAEFRVTGIPMDHINGHLHFHLHPTIFGLLKRHANDWGIRAMRVTEDPLMLNLRIAGGRYFYRCSRALIFGRLAGRTRTSLARRRIVQSDRVFGLLQDGRITEKYLLRLLSELWPGTYELYAHPDNDDHAHETEALCSPRVRELIEQRKIQLVRYADLYPGKARE